MAVSVPGQFPSTNGQRGLLELASTSLSAVALRFDPSGSFTSAPVYAGTGSTIVGSSGGSTPGSGSGISSLSDISLSNLQFISGGQSNFGLVFDIQKYSDGSYTPNAYPEISTTFVGANPYQGITVTVGFKNIVLSGNTFTYQDLILAVQSTMMDDSTGLSYPLTSASVQLTLTPNGAPYVGSVSGTFTFVSALATFTGTITGTYTGS